MNISLLCHLEAAELFVARPEVVAPLGHAVSLVHGDAGDTGHRKCPGQDRTDFDPMSVAKMPLDLIN